MEIRVELYHPVVFKSMVARYVPIGGCAASRHYIAPVRAVGDSIGQIATSTPEGPLPDQGAH